MNAPAREKLGEEESAEASRALAPVLERQWWHLSRTSEKWDRRHCQEPEGDEAIFFRATMASLRSQ
jgi:hypothetical protein